MTLSRLRLVLWLLVGMAALAATGLYAYTTMTRSTQAAGLGQGDYQLATTAGDPFTRDSLKGRPSMVFFGFTHCPEVCPTTMAEMSTWFEQLGEEGSDLRGYFVSVDPERDTPAILGEYVSWVSDRITGITGTPEEVAKIAKAWGVYYEKVPLEGEDYTMDHTASVFLLDTKGEFQGTIAYGEDSTVAVQKLRNLLAKS